MTDELLRKVSVVIPVFNEESTLERILDKVRSADVLGLSLEIVIVDDCSTDGSSEILSRITSENEKVIRHSKNLGKGASLRTGFLHISGDIVIVQDADLEYDPDEYHRLIKPIVDNFADVVFGSRFTGSGPHRVLYFWHFAGNKLLTTLSNMFTNLNLTDMESCYKVFRADVIRKILPYLRSDRFGIEPELIARCAKLAKQSDCRLYEVGISYYGRTYKEGKKNRSAGWIRGFVVYS